MGIKGVKTCAIVHQRYIDTNVKGLQKLHTLLYKKSPVSRCVYKLNEQQPCKPHTDFFRHMNRSRETQRISQSHSRCANSAVFLTSWTQEHLPKTQISPFSQKLQLIAPLKHIKSCIQFITIYNKTVFWKASKMKALKYLFLDFSLHRRKFTFRRK